MSTRRRLRSSRPGSMSHAFGCPRKALPISFTRRSVDRTRSHKSKRRTPDGDRGYAEGPHANEPACDPSALLFHRRGGSTDSTAAVTPLQRENRPGTNQPLAVKQEQGGPGCPTLVHSAPVEVQPSGRATPRASPPRSPGSPSRRSGRTRKRSAATSSPRGHAPARSDPSPRGMCPPRSLRRAHLCANPSYRGSLGTDPLVSGGERHDGHTRR